MRNLSSSFLVFLFAVFFVTVEAFGARAELINERVQQTLMPYQRLSLKKVLRLQEPLARRTEVLSLSIMAQSFNGRGQLDVMSQGRVVGSLLIRRRLTDATLELTPPVDLNDLELTTSDEIFLEEVTAEVRKERIGPGRPAPEYPTPQYPAPQYPTPYEQRPAAYSTLSLYGSQESRGMLELNLSQMVRSQLGYTLSGVEVQGVTIEGGPAFGRYATVQILVNGRSMGERQLPPGRQVVTLQINASEDVRDLRLMVRGDARLESIQIRIGNVRQVPVPPRAERVSVREEISSGRTLDLSRFLPYENRLVRSITIEARARYTSAEVALVGLRGEFFGSAIVTQSSSRQIIHLDRPTAIRELRLQSFSTVTVDNVELEFDNFSHY